MSLDYVQDQSPADPKRCRAAVALEGGWHWRQCSNKWVAERPSYKDPAKTTYYCRVHDPVAKEKRRKARGPTRWEVELAARQRHAEDYARLQRVEAAAARALDLLEKGGTLDAIEALRSALAKEAP